MSLRDVATLRATATLVSLDRPTIVESGPFPTSTMRPGAITAAGATFRDVFLTEQRHGLSLWSMPCLRDRNRSGGCSVRRGIGVALSGQRRVAASGLTAVPEGSLSAQSPLLILRG